MWSFIADWRAKRLARKALREARTVAPDLVEQWEAGRAEHAARQRDVIAANLARRHLSKMGQS